MATIDYCSWEDVNRFARQLVAKIDEPLPRILQIQARLAEAKRAMIEESN